MSYSYASMLSRIEDIVSRLVRKLSSFVGRVLYRYSSSLSEELKRVESVSISVKRGGLVSAESLHTEDIVARAFLKVVSIIYAFFSFAECKFLRVSNKFARTLQGIQASLEDALSYSSLYMNVLFVVAILAVVVMVWIL